MQDRRAKPIEPLPLSAAPEHLKEAIRQLDGVSWEDHGSSVVVNRNIAPPVRFNSTQLISVRAHQGNPEAIAEILREILRPKVRPQQRARIRKPGFEKRIR
jgi:hypothetical protein